MPSWFNVYKNRRVAILLGLGFSSGLPLALTGSTLQAWLVSEHVNLALIGAFSLVGLPYTLKMVWSPLMDRFTPPWLGRRRGWIVITQLLLAAVILVLGSVNPGAMPWATAYLALLLAFLSASQDIAIDAYRADVLEDRERGAGAATTVMGYRLAMLTSGAFAFILSDRVPWSRVYAIMALLMAGNTLFAIAAPEPSEAVTPPGSLKAAVWEPLTSYFRRSGAVEMLLFIVVFKLGDVITAAMSTPFLLDLGFTRTDVGMVNKLFGLVSTILGTLVGGSIISRIGINRSLWVFGILQAVSNFSFMILAVLGKSYPAMVATVAIENIFSGMGTAGFIAFLMGLCDRKFTATQYALLSSLMAITRVLAGAPTGFMANHFGWVSFFLFSGLASLPGILLLFRFAPWNGAGEATGAPASPLPG
jgi:PAT family beta-lactamase induction signal transducer AmpG